MQTYNLYFKNIHSFKKKIAKLELNSENILVQVFTSEIKKEKIKIIRNSIIKLIPNCKLIGSTTDGEINQAKVSKGKTLVSISVFENTKLEIVSKKLDKKNYSDCFSFGKNIALKFSKAPQVSIIFADGFHVNGENFLNGLHHHCKNTTFAGGLAGTNGGFKITYVFDNKHIYKKGAVGIGLFNKNLNIYTDFKFNWTSIGKQMTITKAKDNQVFTIDNKTAYDTYTYYLGEDIAKMLPKVGIEFPLIIEKDEKVARAVLSVEKDGSLRFAGNLKTGDKVRFGYGDKHTILQKSEQLPSSILKTPIESFFIYSCMARRRFMPKSIFKEIEPYTKISNVAGFFTHGEFFTNEEVKLLNQSMTILGLSENKKKRVKKHIKTKHIPYSTSDFSTSQKALTHLINTTTTELLDLNKNLEVAVDQKIKEIRKKDKILIESSKLAAMGEMIGNIAHQWRQPLNAIATLNMKIEALLEFKKNIDMETYKPIGDKITYQLEYMSKTIDDFRNFFINTQKKKFNVNELIYEVLDLLYESYRTKNITINYSGVDCFIRGKKNELVQVFLNLFNNAKDAISDSNKDGVIDISLTVNHNIITITVGDNGGGIKESIQNKIFEPYFSTKFKAQGTGIGLYMSYRIITEHFYGTIKVKNHLINNQKGCCFTITLPIDTREHVK